jgi:hypothetical protein
VEVIYWLETLVYRQALLLPLLLPMTKILSYRLELA